MRVALPRSEVGGHNKMLARYMGQYGKQKHCSPVETEKQTEGNGTKNNMHCEKFLINVGEFRENM